MTLFCNTTQRRKDAKNELRRIAATTPQLPPICRNEDVLQVLYNYNYKHHPNRLGSVIIERSLLDPPIPGWTGFVPRAKVTELGHGVRYRVMAKNCFQDFKNLVDRIPYNSSISVHRGETHEMIEVRKIPHAYQRFYRPEGMMPKYTGHIPHKHLIAGKTFGNLCRSSSVCTHTEDSYGAYLTKKQNALVKHQQTMKYDVNN
ncbi:sperm-associated microtubule inner protein 5 [Rhea pennata]|uniref:sperm-associated microtubule inner protein 5 n=1 Tax=Rhea pennata TaxID=8795 RepID=UPI002E25EA15